MNLRKRFFPLFVFSVLLPFGCGGGGERFSILHRPVDIGVSSVDIAFDSRIARFVYVADSYTGGIVVVDQVQERLVDTDDNTDFNETSIPVGGEPVALAVLDRSEGPRIFVADGLNRMLLAYDAVPPADTASNFLSHIPVSLGAAASGRASRPLFRNTGRLSSPVLSVVNVNASTAQTEEWKLQYEGDTKGYLVTGSKSGEQQNRAFEGTAYTSDNGALSFTVVAGAEKTSSGDRFEFGTVVTSPLGLTGRPIDLKIDSGNLYVVTTDPAAVVVLDLETLAVTSTLALADGSGTTPTPSGAALGEGHLYVSNSATGNFFDLDTSSLAVGVISSGVQSRSIGFDPQTNVLYFLPVGEQTLAPWDLASASPLSTIRLSHFGLGFTPYTLDGASYALVPTAVGGTDVLNTQTRSRVDSNVRDTSTQSEAVATQFYDVLPESSPELISVTTRDGATRTERWQLVYEGVVPGTEGLAVEISGDALQAAGAQFQTIGIQEGDLVVIGPYEAKEEATVTEVTSETALKLSGTPTNQGSQTIEIRPPKSYVAIGAESGSQKLRIQEGVSYESDDGAISVMIRPSRIQPTTRGDFFTFLTVEGIDPVGGQNNRFARKAAVFVRPGEVDPNAYVIAEGSGVISALNLRTLRQRRTIP